MIDTQAFAPFYKVTVPGSQVGGFVASVTVAATAGGANASGAIPAANSGGGQMQIANASLTSFAYVNLGVFSAVVTATVAASYPVPPMTTKVITVDQEVTGASVILAAGTGNVIFTRGNGVG